MQELVASCPAGPLQDRLVALAERVAAGVDAAWQIATRAQTAARTTDALRTDVVQAQLKDARRRLASAQQYGEDTSGAEEEVRLLSDEHASLNQLLNAIDDAGERLRMVDLKLDAAVARVAQVVLSPDHMTGLAAVDQDLASVIDELGALRAGLDEVNSTGP